MWVSKEEAKEAGMTHEGVLYGVKVYMRLGTEAEIVAIAEFLPCTLWLMLCDTIYDTVAMLMPEYHELDTPMTIGAEL
jgi:hypothetical protein